MNFLKTDLRYAIDQLQAARLVARAHVLPNEWPDRLSVIEDRISRALDALERVNGEHILSYVDFELGASVN